MYRPADFIFDATMDGQRQKALCMAAQHHQIYYCSGRFQYFVDRCGCGTEPNFVILCSLGFLELKKTTFAKNSTDGEIRQQQG